MALPSVESYRRGLLPVLGIVAHVENFSPKQERTHKLSLHIVGALTIVRTTNWWQPVLLLCSSEYRIQKELLRTKSQWMKIYGHTELALRS